MLASPPLDWGRAICQWNHISKTSSGTCNALLKTVHLFLLVCCHDDIAEEERASQEDLSFHQMSFAQLTRPAFVMWSPNAHPFIIGPSHI
jgi:hypothetical protein